MRGSLLINRRGVQRFRQLAIGAAGSVKIKLLLCCCIVFMMLALAGRASDFMRWTKHDVIADQLSVPGKGYAIVVNTWKRYDLLKQSISHYSSCAGLDSIHIVWSEPNPPSESLVEHLNHILQSKSKVEFAFSVWQSAPDNMVGFVPRSHWIDQLEGKKDYYVYGGWWSVWWTGTYSMVLSKAAFFHKKYLSLYSNEMPASIREYTTKNRNCEDIAMSFLVANATGAPPIWVKGKIFEIGSTGISSLGGHSERRTTCVNRFVAEYGRMPLVYTSVKTVDSRRAWFW
ncbi:hypothetical protein MANES_07G126700v8 [Manihot esculenta]|uniref:Uncharacterized protein n=1 Tax=Manihot esculenta TaxID=3983 RepID=A0ACB7HFY3_MANES|nr:hypothetical protein MANES_07G126700v8 [Manihot esculenta]